MCDVLQDPLTPYDEVFGLERFRECELIHGRWAMVATLGVLIGESSTGVSWCAPSCKTALYHEQRMHLCCRWCLERNASFEKVKL